MSSFQKVQTEISDQEMLADALRLMGCEGVESHTQAQKLVNHWDGGSWGTHAQATAEVIVRKETLAGKYRKANISDIGFKRNTAGKFELQVNDMDRHVFDEKWMAEVKTHMGIAKATRLARRQYGCAKPQIRRIETANGVKHVVKFLIPLDLFPA